MQFYVSLDDLSGNKPLVWYHGELAGCPPLPRVGEEVYSDEFLGIVERVIHINKDRKGVQQVFLIVRKMPEGEKLYSDEWNV